MPLPSLLQVALPADWEHAGFGIYVHWPFCEAKCPYCDFNSHVARQIDHGRWRAAYLKDLDRVAAELPHRTAQTVFFGGGTPSLMEPETVKAIIDRIRNHWPMSNDPEITLEANPGSVEAGKFRAFSDAGVSRISMGVQALNDEDLRRLGRIHTVKDAERAFDVARSVFDRVSFDLIYARQHQTLKDWEAELKQALNMAIDHLSLYQLTIEDGTSFSDRYARGGLKGLPIDDVAADMFDLTQQICGAAGYEAYEVSNHAKPGSESRHNLIYWRYGDYVGIGPGAHGRITLNGQRYATEARRMPHGWLDDAERGKVDHVRDALTRVDQANEYLLMGLRLSEGINVTRLHALAQQTLDPHALRELQDLDLITQHGPRLKATDHGRLLLNSVIEKLLFTTR